MRPVSAAPSARGLTLAVDTLSTVTRAQADALVSAGVSARLGYIDHVTIEELADGAAAGLPFGPITYALEFDGARAVARLGALGIPQGVTVWLDLEGQNLDVFQVIAKVNAWSVAVRAAGYEPGLYVGAGCPLSSGQLTALESVRYWHSCSRVAVEPARGYCMIQLRPDDVTVCGVVVDVNAIQVDYAGDLPTFCI